MDESIEEFGPALGRTIKVLRVDRGIERKDLARAADISYSYLTEIENGVKPPSTTVFGRIAEALGVRSSDLLAGAEDRVAEDRMAEGAGFDASAGGPSGVYGGQLPMPAAPEAPAFMRLDARLEQASGQRDVRRKEAHRQETRSSWFSRSARAGAPRELFDQEPVPTRPPTQAERAFRRAARQELVELLDLLETEDVERVLDLVRRFVR